MESQTAGHRFSDALVVALVLAALLGTWLPGGARPRVTFAHAEDDPLDLAAIALTPDDLDQAGLPGFGIASVDGDSSGWRLLGDAAAESVAANQLDNIDGLLGIDLGLAQAGWQREYRRLLAQPDPVDPTLVNVAVASSVDEYGDGAGADAALTLLMNGGESVKLDGAPVGERTEIRRDELVGIGSRLVVAFRAGNLLGSVEVVEYGGTGDPELDPAVQLAQRLQARVAAAVPGPALDAVALRLATVATPSEFETYWRLDGETFADYGESPEHLQAAAAGFGDADAVYQLEDRLPAGPDESIQPDYVERLLRFPDESSASAWLQGLPTLLASDVANANGDLTVDPIPDAATIGDESQTYAVTEAGDGGTAQGYRVYVRVGADVARVQFEAGSELDLASVEALASAQADCLQAGSCAGEAQLPAQLAGLNCPLPAQTADSPGSILDRKSRLVADRATHGPDWRITAPGSDLVGPVAGDGFLVFGTSHADLSGSTISDLSAVEAASGAPRWCVPIGSVQAEPVVAGDRVLTLVSQVSGSHKQSLVVALDASTGSEQWQFPLGWPSVPTEAGLTVSDGTLYVSTLLGDLVALDTATGQPRWLFQVPPDATFDQAVLSAPTFADDTVYVTGGHTLYALDAETGDLRWRYDVADDNEYLGTPAVADGAVYVGGQNAAYAIDAESGDELWQTGVDGAGGGRIVPGDGALVLAAQPPLDPSSVTALVALDPTTGDQLWRLDGDGPISRPTVVGDVVYAGTQGALLAISAADGSQIASFPLDGTTGTPVVVDGHLYVGGGSDQGSVELQSIAAPGSSAGVVPVHVGR